MGVLVLEDHTMTKSTALIAALFILAGCPKKAPTAAVEGDTTVTAESKAEKEAEEDLPEATEPEED